MELVTGRTGEAHITSQQDRQKHQGVFGEGAVILETGNMLAPELQNSNEIHIKDGALMYQGALFSVKGGTYDRITINNGNQGKKRKDLIVARYTYNPKEDIELGEWRVIQGEPTEGTPAIPEVTTGDIQKGDAVVECPVFVVTLDGINVTGIDIIPKRMKSIPEIEKELDSLNGNMEIEKVSVTSELTIYRQGSLRIMCVNNGSTDAEGKIGVLDPQDFPPQYVMFPAAFRGQSDNYFISINPKNGFVKLFKGNDVAQLNSGKHIESNASWFVINE